MPEPDKSWPSDSTRSSRRPRRTSRRGPGTACPPSAKDGKLICFFQPAAKFKARYATFGFEEAAHLDDGIFWPTSFALKKLTAADEAKIAALVKRAVG